MTRFLDGYSRPTFDLANRQPPFQRNLLGLGGAAVGIPDLDIHSQPSSEDPDDAYVAVGLEMLSRFVTHGGHQTEQFTLPAEPGLPSDFWTP